MQPRGALEATRRTSGVWVWVSEEERMEESGCREMKEACKRASGMTVTATGPGRTNVAGFGFESLITSSCLIRQCPSSVPL